MDNKKLSATIHTGTRISASVQIPNKLKGSAMARGSDGLSAYQVAQNNGFIGTEKEWLQSLKGEKGKEIIRIKIRED